MWVFQTHDKFSETVSVGSMDGHIDDRRRLCRVNFTLSSPRLILPLTNVFTALRYALPHLFDVEPSLLLQFVGMHVPSFSCVGTPAQLRSFLGLVRKGVITPQHKARVCFDLDRFVRAARSGPGGERSVPVRPVESSNMRLLQVGDEKSSEPMMF